jgi:hypothetical protein
MFATMRNAFAQIGTDFSFQPFSNILQLLVEETLVEQGHSQIRQGSILTPTLSVRLVLSLTLQRDLNYHKTLNWMVSGLHWLGLLLPSQLFIVKDGAISYARIRLGVDVFRVIFYKLAALIWPITPDSYGFVSVAFNGSMGTMPDTARGSQ